MVFPYLKNGSLLDLLMKAKTSRLGMTIEISMYFCRLVVQLVSVLHKTEQLAHLDLKLENIMINDDLTLSLIDFGHS